MARDDEWKKLHRAADKAESKLVRDLVRSINQVATDKLVRGVQAALTAGDRERAVRVAIAALQTAAAEFQMELGNTLLTLFNEAGGIAGSSFPPSLNASFDLTNPYSVEWARTHSSEFVRSLEASTLTALRSSIVRSFSEGIPPRETARMLRNTVGLSSREATALHNYRAFLEQTSGRDSLADLPPSVRARLKRGDIRARTPQLGPDRIEAAMEKYRARLLNERALTLVRTETIAAASAGQQEMWRQAVAGGLIEENRTRRKWIVTPDDRLCPICKPMAGQTRRLNESFISPYNQTSAKGPPIHMRCRCAMGLVFVKETVQ